jgi:predicted metal-dependent hydrolase
MSDRTIHQFVVSRLDWIRRQRQKLQAWTPPSSLAYLDGERHWVWGESCRLDVAVSDARPCVELLPEGVVRLQVRLGASVEQKRALLATWYRALVEVAAPPIVARWEQVLGQTVARVSVRHMTTRWGSCTPRTRRIRLSSELAKKPPECLEYVVVHELVHLLEASHNRRFVRLMDQFLPDWRRHRAALNGPR